MNIRVAPALFAVLLLSFLMPWFVVSCQGQTMVSASGLQILTADYDSPMMDSFGALDDAAASADAAAMQEEIPGSGTLRIVVLIVLLSALAGLVLTLRGETAAPQQVAALGGLPAILLILVLLLGPGAFRNGLAAANDDSATSGDDMFGDFGAAMGEMMLNAIKIEFQPGFYIALLASLGAAGVGYYAWRNGKTMPSFALSPSSTPPSQPTSPNPPASPESAGSESDSEQSPDT